MGDLVDRTLKLWRQSPFVYGQTDCLIGLGEYAAAAGRSVAVEAFRGTYSDEAGAQMLLERHGGHEGLIRLLGLPQIMPHMAERGDIVLWNTGEYVVGALCTGYGIAGRTDRTVFEIDRRFATLTCAWKI